MNVTFVRERSITTVGPGGLSTRIFSVGDNVNLPEIHAQTFIAEGDAVLAPEKPAKGPTAARETEPKGEGTPAAPEASQPDTGEPAVKQSRWGKKRS